MRARRSACAPARPPRFRSTVESVRSRCHRDTGSFSAKCFKRAFAMPRLPSAFSKSIDSPCGAWSRSRLPRRTAPGAGSRAKYIPTRRGSNRSARRSLAATASQYSGSIQSLRLDLRGVGVVLAAQRIPRSLRLMAGQSALGTAATCALKFPTAPVPFPEDCDGFPTAGGRVSAAQRCSRIPCRASWGSPAVRGFVRASPFSA